MAIEFRCPYCAAPIRVGDDAAGKPGRCPRCATRLTVPQPVMRPVVPAASAPPPEVEILPEPILASAPEIAPVMPGELPNPAVSVSASPLVRRVKRRRRRSAAWVIPLLCGLALFGGMGWYVWQHVLPKPLAGELVAEVFDDAEIPPVLVSLDHSRLPMRQRTPLLEALEAEPVPLLSDLMQVQIRGAKSGLSISIAPGPKTVWYRIDPSRHPGLAEYRMAHAMELDRPRQAEVDQAAEEFLERFAEVRDGKSPETSVTSFRDRLALNALVRGLGYHVTATVGPRQYPCVAETDDGHLYFLLPPGLQQFELTGRKHADGPARFSGHFTVKVQPAARREKSTLDAGDEPMSTEPSDSVVPEN
jgi:hypothetical protein